MISVRVPGKVMLAGEYAVLTGRPALAATLDQHLLVRARTGSPYGSDSNGLLVTSDLWVDLGEHQERLPVGYLIDRRGSYVCPLYAGKNRPGKEWGPVINLLGNRKAILDALEQQVPSSHLPLLLAAWEGAQTFKIDGGALHVISELDVRFGLGSSSALYLGVFGACGAMAGAWGQNPGSDQPNWQIPRLAMKLQHTLQKRASGYDIATQFLGGMVEFQIHQETQDSLGDPYLWPGKVVRHPEGTSRRLARYAHVFVGGRGAPTGPLVKSTVDWIHERGVWQDLCSLDERVQASLKQLLAISPSEATPLSLIEEFYGAVKNHRQLIRQMPQYPGEIAIALQETPGCDKAWTFKTTGAGGEDALLLWGEIPYLMDATKVLRGLGWKRLEAGFERFGMQVQLNQKGVHKNATRDLGSSLRGEFR